MDIIPEINMISDFEAGMKCLQNPSLISRLYPFSDFSGVGKVSQVYSFWKWGALFLAIFATFNSIIKRFIKLILVNFHKVKPQLEQVFDFDDEYDYDDDVSLASSSDEEQDFEEDDRSDDEDFCVKGSFLEIKNQWQNGNFGLRKRGSFSNWSEFTSGKNVVKLWDSLGLSLDFDEDLINRDSGSIVSTWNSNQNQFQGEYSGNVWNIPSVVLTAKGKGQGNGVLLSGYDKRMPRQNPALVADWKSTEGEICCVDGSKVYVRDDVTGVMTVGDVRNVRVPLETVTESDGDTWWDADAVIVDDDFENFR